MLQRKERGYFYSITADTKKSFFSCLNSTAALDSILLTVYWRGMGVSRAALILFEFQQNNSIGRTHDNY